MDEFATLKPADRRILFEAAAARLNIAAALGEKDFWVCWTLKELFRLPIIGRHLIFKGGTSLSKVFKVIERFSEDIDISINREFLGFGGANDPEAGTSNKDRHRRIDALRSACQRKITGELLPALESAVRAKLGRGEQWALRQDDGDPDQQTLLFEYPTVFPQATSQFIRRAVKIEMGARSDHWPSELKVVTPYVAELFPQGFKEPNCTVKVLSAERTFWEKATILHAEFHRPAEKPIPERFSRHYYDFSELIRKGVADDAAKQLDLLERVAKHKSLFFKSSWAKSETAAKGTLRLHPPEHRIQALRDDYRGMREMFFGEPPTFDEILEMIQAWERKFNRK